MLKLMIMVTLIMMVAGLVTKKLTFRDILGYVKTMVVFNVFIVKGIYKAIKAWFKIRPIDVTGEWVA